jgi:hypothetical protein
MTENIYMLSIDNSSLISLISSTIERLILSYSIHQAHLKFYMKSSIYDFGTFDSNTYFLN